MLRDLPQRLTHVAVLALAAVALVLAGPAPEAAAKPHPWLANADWNGVDITDDPQIERGLLAAEVYWRRMPCRPRVRTFISNNADVAAAAPLGAKPCIVWIDQDYLAERPGARALCIVIVHEVGHLIGIPHLPGVTVMSLWESVEPPSCLQPRSVLRRILAARAERAREKAGSAGKRATKKAGSGTNSTRRATT